MKTEELKYILFLNQDICYQQFQRKLIPNIAPETIIGVRTPVLRALSKELEDSKVFLKQLPHAFFEENQIHSFLLGAGKDFEAVLDEVELFLPYVDNWATCDQLTPRVFCKHRKDLLPAIYRWVNASHPYTLRFGIKMLMDHFLEEDFSPEYVDLVASVQSDAYYVRMMIAWYFATALAKQYEVVFPYISGYHLGTWIHNKAIQKALESYRITPDQKRILRGYRI